jgi:hypothetical protein
MNEKFDVRSTLLVGALFKRPYVKEFPVVCAAELRTLMDSLGSMCIAEGSNRARTSDKEKQEKISTQFKLRTRCALHTPNSNQSTQPRHMGVLLPFCTCLIYCQVDDLRRARETWSPRGRLSLDANAVIRALALLDRLESCLRLCDLRLKSISKFPTQIHDIRRRTCSRRSSSSSSPSSSPLTPVSKSGERSIWLGTGGGAIPCACNSALWVYISSATTVITSVSPT